MQISNIPFGTTDWSGVEAVVGDGERDLGERRGEGARGITQRTGKSCRQRFVFRGHQRAIVLVRQILFWSCRMPYSSASAVGGQPGT